MLSGKVALITGGSQGIGKAIALTYAKAGADVAFFSLGEPEADNVVAEIRAMGRKADHFVANVASKESVTESVQKVLEEFGTIDILVNNAGITRDMLLARMKEEDWDAVLNVNLKGMFLMIQAVIPTMMKKKSGKIVNIASVSGMMGNAGQANYSAAKAGVIGLTKTVAREYASRHINANAIAPGFIRTDMTAKLSPKVVEAAINTIPLGEMGVPQNVADTALFLASPLSDYITGEVIKVDGGVYI